MDKVNNKKIINQISVASIRNNKNRNIIVIIAIILTTLLFTALFTIGFGMKESVELQTMRMVGTSYHGGFKYLNEEEYDKLKSHPLIKEYGHRRMIGVVTNEELKKENVEISYGDENYLKRGFVHPIVGRLPKGKNEIITDTKVLDLLGVPHKAGEKFLLEYQIYDSKGRYPVETIQEEFLLSGFYPVDPLMGARMMFTSEEYIADLNLPPDNISLNVMFSNSFNIEKKIYKILVESGYSPLQQDTNYIDVGINWAYMTEGFKNAAPEVVVGGIVILLIVIFTGYLIIYNIFQISVLKDIRFYGLLKTIGTTSKQLKKIIRRQALMLSVIGIPLGLIVGYVVGNLLLPIIVNRLNMDKSIKISFSPLIFMFASVFSLVTVFISSRKPGKIAGGVAPIEATKMGEIDEVKYSKEKKIQGEVKLSRIAFSNLARNKLRTTIVILSMSLGLILFNSIYTFTNGFDEEKFVDGFMNTDFNIASVEYYKYRYSGNGDDLSNETIKQIEATKGYKSGGRIYYSDLVGIWIEYNKIVELEGKLPVQLFGLDEYLIYKQQVVKGRIDIEKYKSGEYILIGVNEDYFSDLEIEYNVGDKVVLLTEYGSREFEVMALIPVNYKNNARRWHLTFVGENGERVRSQFAYLPTSIYKEVVKEPATMVYQFDVESDYIGSFEELLKKLVEGPKLDLDYESRDKLVKEHEGMKNMFLIVGGILSLIVGIVGIMNFINSIITSILTRKKEFALLQSIGMTNEQLDDLLTKEGLIYSFLTISITSIFSILISITVLKGFEKGMPFYTYSFTALPLAIALPIILILGYMVPLWARKVVVKESVVERIRNES